MIYLGVSKLSTFAQVKRRLNERNSSNVLLKYRANYQQYANNSGIYKTQVNNDNLFVLPGGGSLSQEGGHALFLVLQSEHGVEKASLQAQALLQVEFVGGVGGFLGHGYGDAGEGGDLVA